MLRSTVIVGVFLVLMGSLVKQPDAPALAAAQNQPAAGPIPVRNERPRSGQEVLVLRHQQLRKGAHDAYYRSSLQGVWPWYEKIGTRVVGQLQGEIYGSPPVFMPALAERYRLAR